MAQRFNDKKKIIIGTRGSRLALAQTREVLTGLSKVFLDRTFEVKVIKTKGDKLPDSPLAKIDGKGFFVKEIEEALRRGEITLAVHSLKDLPVETPAGLTIGAVLKR
ncbi:hypothetical protein HZB08_03380, partial [Candidatus Saganbacteria bacterium]|nr:hypothetical protein [Candidatus Saganbacteria bacterium]